MCSEMTDYYKPKLVTEKPVKLSKTGYAGKLPAGASDGFIKTGIEEDVVVQRISKDLYANPASGIREQYANEARACRQAKNLGASPEIRLTVNARERKIVLEGVDSMGMSKDTFENVYCVLGRSTNFDGTESGQFGFGRAAYTCISDIMILETHSRETGEKYAVMGKSGVGFQYGLPEPDMEQFGTRITMTARADVKLESVMDMVRDCATLSGVKTFLHVDENDPVALKQRSLRRLLRKYGKIDKNIVFRHNCIFELEKDGIQIAVNSVTAANAVVNLRRPVNEARHSFSSYLCGVPIEYTYRGKYQACISDIQVNIADERKYRPTPDRERLSDDSASRVTEKIDEMIHEYVHSFSSMPFTEYMQRDDVRIIDSVNTCCTEKIEEFKLYTEALQAYMMYTKEKYDGKHLGLLRRDVDFLVSWNLHDELKNAISEHDPGISVYEVSKKQVNDIFKRLGVKTAEEYVKENGISVKKPKKKPKKVRVYKTYGSTSVYSEELDCIGDKVIVLGSEFEKFQRCCLEHSYVIRESFGDNFGFIKRGSLGRDCKVGTPYETFEKKMAATKIPTTLGELTLEEVRLKNREVKIFPVSQYPTTDVFEPGVFVVMVDSKSVGVAVLYLSMYDVEFGQATGMDVVKEYRKLFRNRYHNDDDRIGATSSVLLSALGGIKIPEIREQIMKHKEIFNGRDEMNTKIFHEIDEAISSAYPEIISKNNE